MKKLIFSILLTGMIVTLPTKGIGDISIEDAVAMIGILNAMLEIRNALGCYVPEGFRRIDRTRFVRNTQAGTSILIINDVGRVVVGIIGSAFETTHEAIEFNSLFYLMFEDTAIGTFLAETNSGDVYRLHQDNMYAIIDRPIRRADGMIISSVSFSRNLHYIDP